MKVQLLTQNPCPKCDNLKMFLKMGLGDKYKEDIEIVHLQESPARFEKLKEDFKVQSTPVLIFEDKALFDCTPAKSEEFLRVNLGR
jgi:thioredoxin-related protein